MRDGDEGAEWVSVTDLMSGLMFIFLALAVHFMLQADRERKLAEAQKERLEQVAVKYVEVRETVAADLSQEFPEAKLRRWNASFDPTTLAFRFLQEGNAAVPMFGRGSPDIEPAFAGVLTDFFPTFLGVLRRPEFEHHVVEIRIEGHTSSEWENGKPPDQGAYLANMSLSQARSLAVLRFVSALGPVRQGWDWLRPKLTANGLSSSHPVLDGSGNEDLILSRRVEFRVVTDAEKRLNEIMEKSHASP
jgi:outer membrane protein OmpA-like peptidoglycan-associated protein